MENEAGRYIALDGCYNFRDLGGYRTADGRRVRSGQLFRSDALHHLTESDVAHVRDELGLRSIIDLRSSAETSRERTSPLAQPPVSYHHVPLFSENAPVVAEDEIPDDLGERYFLILTRANGPLARSVELIARSREPVVFHCAAGKDRTGVLSAVVLGLLGVAHDDIVLDYVSTSRNLDRIIERLRGSPSYAQIFSELPPETLTADAETMEKLLLLVERQLGSLGAWAEQNGLGPETRSQLEARLLE